MDYQVVIMTDSMVHLVRKNTFGIYEDVANFGPVAIPKNVDRALIARDTFNTDHVD